MCKTCSDRIASLEKQRTKLLQALEPFAKMHRKDSDPHELACERGVASDKTMIFSGDFEWAAEVMKEVCPTLYHRLVKDYPIE